MDLVNDCDRYANSVVTIPQLTISSFPYFQDDSESYTRMANPYYHLRVSSVPATLGYVVDSIRKVPNWIVDDKSTPQTLTFSAGYDEPPCLAIVGRRQRQCAALVPSRFWKSDVMNSNAYTDPKAMCCSISKEPHVLSSALSPMVSIWQRTHEAQMLSSTSEYRVERSRSWPTPACLTVRSLVACRAVNYHSKVWFEKHRKKLRFQKMMCVLECN